MTSSHEKIRAICTTFSGDLFAVSEWEKYVQIWDIENGFIRKIETDIVSGMTNAISISADGIQLVIAGYDHKTVTLFNTVDGTIIWQRNDIKKPSKAIILDHYPQLIYVNTESQGSFFLDRKTGDTIEKLRGIEFIRENSFSDIDQFEKSASSTLINRVNRKTIKSFNHKSFALLDACFSKDKIICAYSTNPLEAISLNNFETLWTTSVTGHFLEIEYCKDLDNVLGIRWEYEKGGSKFLCYIDINTGKVEKEIDLGLPIEIEFLKQGSLILTSQGNLYSTLTNQVIKQFDFENH